MDLAAKGALAARGWELRQHVAGRGAEQFAHERAEDGLVDDRGAAEIWTAERVQDGRADHVVQVHLRGNGYGLQNNKMVYNVRAVR